MSGQLVEIILLELGASAASFGAAPLDALHALERQLEQAVISTRAGEIDGHDIAPNGRDANIWTYGPDARRLLNSMRRPLCGYPLTAGGSVLLRFGAIDDPAVKTETILISDFCGAK